MRHVARCIESMVYPLRTGPWRARVRFSLDDKLCEAQVAGTYRDRVDAALGAMQEITFAEIHYENTGRLPPHVTWQPIEPVSVPTE